MGEKIILLTGGFDPPHVGHLAMFEQAARYDAKVVVGLNSNTWLLNKKGYVFMEWQERATMLLGLKHVDEVFAFDDSDGTAIEAVKTVANRDSGNEIEPICDNVVYFANGGDRTQENVPEQEICEELNVEMLWGIGGTHKPQSSSAMIKNVIRQIDMFTVITNIRRVMEEHKDKPLEDVDEILAYYLRDNLV